MSLINDALKRANQAQRQQPVAGPLGVPLQSTEPSRKPILGPILFMAAFGLIAVGVGAGLIMLGMRAFRTPPEPATEQVAAAQQTTAKPALTPPPAPPMPTTVNVSKPTAASGARAPVSSPPEQPKRQPVKAIPAPANPLPASQKAAVKSPDPTPIQEPDPVPVVPRIAVSNAAPAPPANVVAQTKAAPPPVVPPSPPAPEWPDVTLTGIFYSPSRPSAIVNGRKVNVGSSVTGLKVVAIERDSVTLELEGEKKVVYFQ